MNEFQEHVRSIVRAFVKHGVRGFSYLYWRYIVAPQLLRCTHPLERPVTRDDFSIHMIFGHRDVLTALWSLGSFYAVSKSIGRLFVHDDGTLTEVDRGHIYRLFPSATVISRSELPPDAHFLRYSHIEKLSRASYWQAKKILDPYRVSNTEWVLVLDSDMLWFKDPTFIPSALVDGVPWMMSNGHTKCTVDFKDGTRLTPELAILNAGIIFFRKDHFELSRLNDFLERLSEKDQYFIDQAGYAYALRGVKVLPQETYSVKSYVEDGLIVRHYTSPSRARFFFQGIRFIQIHSLMYVRN